MDDGDRAATYLAAIVIRVESAIERLELELVLTLLHLEQTRTRDWLAVDVAEAKAYLGRNLGVASNLVRRHHRQRRE